MTKVWKKRLYWILALTVLGIGAFLLTAWLTFQHIPDWYQPVSVAPEQVQAVKDDAVATLTGDSERSFTRRLTSSTGRFEFRLTEDQLNSWIAIREEFWPPARNWLPSSLSDPVVVFEDGAVRIAATYRGAGGLQTVVSAKIDVAGGPDGIHVKLASVSGGSLPIPGSWLYEALAAMDRRAWPAGRTVPMQYREEPLPALSGLPEGIVLPNAWIWTNGKQPFALVDVRIEPGVLILTVERLPQLPERRRNDHDSSGFFVN